MAQKILYRVGSVPSDTAEGLFFTDNLDYYKHSSTDYKAEDALAYIYDDAGMKVWDPITELDLEVNTWVDIRGLTKDFEKYGIDDECDFELEEEWSVTSTDGLAAAGKRLGYDVTILKEIPGSGGYGPEFDEYVIYNTSCVQLLTESDALDALDNLGD